MDHRHIQSNSTSLAAIDDIISRGKMSDWIDLREAARADPSVLVRIRKVCAAYIHDPYAQRYQFWSQYANNHLGAAADLLTQAAHLLSLLPQELLAEEPAAELHAQHGFLGHTAGAASQESSRQVEHPGERQRGQ